MVLFFLLLLSMTNSLMSDFKKFEYNEVSHISNEDIEKHFDYPQDSNWIDQNICNTYGAQKISAQNFPESYKFLVELVKKYPKEFENVIFLKVCGTNLFAGYTVIGIPYQWLLELESQISVAQQWAEWALLNALGHIHYKHITVLAYLGIIKDFFYVCFGQTFLITTASSVLSDQTIKKSWGPMVERKHIAYATLSFLSAALAIETIMILYSRYVSVPQADDFAVKKCDNEQALRAGIDFIDNVSVEDLAVPSKEDRILKIQSAITSKFE
ncbi:hypothetical protein HYV10_01130 [Candidatus Dependentiae bacterium]|nr:hypothetical protein [Candidatus Dependentiae bacterium]